MKSMSLVLLCMTSVILVSDIINAQSISCYVCGGTNTVNQGCGVPFNSATATTTVTVGCTGCGYTTTTSLGGVTTFARTCLPTLGVLTGCTTAAGTTTCTYVCSGTNLCLASNTSTTGTGTGTGYTYNAAGSRFFLGYLTLLLHMVTFLLALVLLR